MVCHLIATHPQQGIKDINHTTKRAASFKFANIPVTTLHSFKNERDQPATMIVTIASAGLKKMFFEVSTPVEQGATTAPMPSAADFEKLLKAAPI